MGDRPQAIINKQVLEGCDLLVATFWTRLGTPTGSAASGTVEEIQEHTGAGKPAMLYFSSAKASLETVDHEQYRALQQFKQQCQQKGLIESYDSLDDFKDKFRRQLAQKLIDYPAGGSADTPAKSDPELSEAAKELLVEACHDANGAIIRSDTLEGLKISANRRIFADGGDRQPEAFWDAALEALESSGLIKGNTQRSVFQVTHEGYRVVKEARRFGIFPPDEAEAQREYRRAISETLGRLSQEAKAWLTQDAAKFTPQIQEWISRTEAYIRDHLGESYVARFNTTFPVDVPRHVVFIANQTQWVAVESRRWHLAEFMKELESNTPISLR
jgi:hypothetical protein